MKKAIALLLAIVLVMSLFAGCTKTETKPTETPTTGGGTTTPTTPAAPKGSVDGRVVWYGSGLDAGDNKAEKIIANYKKVDPKVTVEYYDATGQADSFEKFDTFIAAGERVDTVYHYIFDIVLRALSGGMLPMDEYIAASGDDFVADYGESTAKMCQADGKYYCIPTALNTYHTYYNKTFFEANKITIPENWTLDQFTEVARQVKSAGMQWGCFVPQTWSDLVVIFAQMAGWQMVVKDASGNVTANWDDPLIRADLEKIYNLSMVEGLQVPYATAKAESLHRRIVLAEQKTGMIIDGAWTLIFWQSYQYKEQPYKEIPFEFGIAKLPRLNDTVDPSVTAVNPVGGNGLPKTCEGYYDAYKFARYLSTTDEVNISFMPAYVNAPEAAVIKQYQQYTNDKGEKFTDLYDVDTIKTNKNPAPNGGVGFYAFYDMDLETIGKYQPLFATLMDNNFATYFTGQISLDDLITTMNEQGNSEIAKVK